MKIINVYLIVLLNEIYGFKKIPLWNEDTIYFSLSLFEEVLSDKKNILVLLPLTLDNIPVKWFKNVNAPITIVSGNVTEISMKETEPYQGYALWTEENNFRWQVLSRMNKISECECFRSNAFMIIYVVRNNWLVEYSIRSLLSYLWTNYKMYNIVVTPLIRDNNNSSATNQHIYSYNMFDNTLQILDEGNITKQLDDRFEDMKGYELKVSLFKNYLGYYYKNKDSGLEGTGVDGEFLNLISTRLNFTPRIIAPKGEDFESETFFETKYLHSLKQVSKQKVDFSLNGRYVKTVPGDVKIEYSNILYEDKICFAVPTGFSYRGWEIFYKACDDIVWFYILVTAIAVSLTVMTIVKIETGRWTSGVLLTVCSMFSVPRSSTPTSSHLRIIVAVCLIFALVFMTLFQAYLFHMIHRSPKKHLYNTIQDIKNSQVILITGGYNETLDWLKDNVNYKTLMHYKVRTSYGFPKNMGRTQASMLISKRHFDFLIDSRRFKVKDRPHLLDQCLITHNLAYIFPRGSPFYKIINEKFVARAIEGDFDTFWYNRFISRVLDYKMRRHYTLFRRADPRSGEESIKLEKLEISFFILGVGYTVSFIVFLKEVLSCNSSSFKRGKLVKINHFSHQLNNQTQQKKKPKTQPDKFSKPFRNVNNPPVKEFLL